MSVSRPRGLGDRLRPGARRLELTPEQVDIRSSALTDLVVITGYSGAGKSTAMAVFEDAGYFCVDNLPPEMIRQLVELFVHEGSKVERAAVVCDVRGGSYFEDLQRVLDDLRGQGTAHRVVFLRADEDVLVARYKETRRRHPLAPHGSVAEGIAAERAVLGGVETPMAFAEGRLFVPVVDLCGWGSAVARQTLDTVDATRGRGRPATAPATRSSRARRRMIKSFARSATPARSPTARPRPAR